MSDKEVKQPLQRQHTAERERYKRKTFLKNPQTLVLLISWGLKLASSGEFPVTVVKKEDHHPGLLALKIMSVCTEERQMVD